MKKILPVIIILITISMIGLTYLQLTWFQNLLQVKQEHLKERGLDAVMTVSKDLNESYSRSAFIRKPKNILDMGGESPMDLMQPATISQRFQLYEIKQKLDNAFAQVGLGKVKYEFVIGKNTGSTYVNEMMSPGYATNPYDSLKDYLFVQFLSPPSGSVAESMVPDEILEVVIPEYKKLVFTSSYIELGGSVVFMLFIMFAFFFTVRALINQKKLSEIKSDFINNMTHEFKTPLATISLAVDALRNEKVINDREKLGYFSGIIKEENKRMNKHVETILQAAILEKQEFQLNKKEVHAHELVQKALDNHHLQLEDKQAVVQMNLNAKNDMIEADEMHFTNLLSNLIDNAIKYSKETLELRITTHSTSRNMVIRIEDNGIGMSRESVKRVFEKFFRAHTGNVHNVKGFGLGMSYVRTIIDAHKGHIKVDSVLGKGTGFTVEVPLLKS